MNPWVKALHDYYTSKISEAIATLNVYLNNSVGVGEHPDLFNEIKKYIDILDDADGKLATIEKYMKPQTTTENKTSSDN